MLRDCVLDSAVVMVLTRSKRMWDQKTNLEHPRPSFLDWKHRNGHFPSNTHAHATGGGGGYLAHPAALMATGISYVSPACIRPPSITGTLSHSHPSPLQLCLRAARDEWRRAHAHAPLDRVGETVALNLSSSSPTSPTTTNPQPSSPSPHAGIPLATVVWRCLPSNPKPRFSRWPPSRGAAG